MSTSPSLLQRFKQVMVSYGLPAGAAAFSAYEAWCAANPSHPSCRLKSSMQQYASYLIGHRAPAPPARAAVSPSGTSSRTEAAPLALGQTLRIRHSLRCEGDNLVIKATDMVANIVTPASVTTGTNLLSFVFFPYAPQLAGSRLAALAQLFEKYSLRRLRFHFQPSVATSTSGQLIMAWDNDPVDGQAAASEQGIRSLYSYRSNVSGTAWLPMTVNCALDPSTRNLFTSPGDDPRLYAAGVLQVANVTGIPASTSLGTVWVEYELLLSSPSELNAGPPDIYWSCTTNTPMSSGGAGTSLLDQAASALITTASNGVALEIVGGLRNWRLSPGSYIIDILAMNSAAAIATTVSLTTQVASGNMTSTAIAANTNVNPCPATVNTQVRARYILQITGGDAYVYPGFSTAVNFSKWFVRVATYDGVPTAAGADIYAF